MPMGNKYQYTGGSVSSSPGDKIKSCTRHVANPSRLSSTGGSHNRGKDNKPK